MNVGIKFEKLEDDTKRNIMMKKIIENFTVYIFESLSIKCLFLKINSSNKGAH